MFKIYTFYRILELNYLEKVFEITTSDLHNAKRAIIESGLDYDLIAINGIIAF